MYDYLISFCRDDQFQKATIHHRGSKLKVNAFDITAFSFKPDECEKKFFVTSGKETLVFETVGYKRQHEVLILQMVSWYCIYCGLNEPQIHNALTLAS